MGSRAGLQLTRRHNNFLPLFKSPISLAPPFGGSCWAVRDLHTGTSSHLRQLGHVQGPIGMREPDPALKAPSRAQAATRAPSRPFPESGPSTTLLSLDSALAEPRMTRRLGRDVISGWRQPLARLHPTRANSGQRWLLLAPGSQGTVWHCQLLQGQEAQETLPLAWWGRAPPREAAPPKEGCPGLVARREPV